MGIYLAEIPIKKEAFKALIAEEQEDRRMPDPYEEAIAQWLAENEDRTEVKTQELFEHVLGIIDLTQVKRSDQTRVGNVMNSLGWLKTRRRVDKVLTYVYEREPR